MKSRHIRCLHCGLIRLPGSDDEMRAHSLTCDKSPAVARIKELEAALQRIADNDQYSWEASIARAALAKGGKT